MAELANDDILCIRSYLKDGYSIQEIEELSGYTREEIMSVKDGISHIESPKNKTTAPKGPDGFSDSVIKMICLILEKGVNDDQAYDTLLLYKKAYSRKKFYRLCAKLRNGNPHYDHIIKDFNIPKEPTIEYISPHIRNSVPGPDENKVRIFCTEESIQEKKELHRRKVELDKRRTAEAIERHERELKERDLKEREKRKRKILSQKSKTNITPEPVVVPPPVKEVTADDVLPKFDALASDDNIRDACILLSKNIPINLISKNTGLSESTINDIKDGKKYTQISKRFGIIPQELRGSFSSILKSIE